MEDHHMYHNLITTCGTYQEKDYDITSPEFMKTLFYTQE